MGKLGHDPSVQNVTLDSGRNARDFLAMICLMVNFEGKVEKRKKKKRKKGKLESYPAAQEKTLLHGIWQEVGELNSDAG